MSHLETIRGELEQLRVRRARGRTLATVTHGIAVALAGALGLFAVDWLLLPGVSGRLLALGLCVGGVVWLARRWAPVRLRVRERVEEVALLLEQRGQLRFDLLAALQFDDGARMQHGSERLRAQVIGEVRDRGVQQEAGNDREGVFRGVRRLLLAAGVWAVLGLTVPGHVLAFVQRAILLPAHYPTRTQIVEVVEPSGRVGFGRPVEFAVRVEGELPVSGEVRLRSADRASGRVLVLEPLESAPGLYTARLDRLIGPLEYTIRMGDALAVIGRLDPIPLPRVQVTLAAELPAYARAAAFPDAGQREIRTLSGATVVVRLESDKPLQQVRAMVEDEERLFERAGPGGWVLRLPTEASEVRRDLDVRVVAVDSDGLSPAEAVRLRVQIMPDQPPRVSAGATARLVVPTATLRLGVSAEDDHGLASLGVRATVLRQDGSTQEKDAAVFTLAGRPGSVKQTLQVPLAELGLAVGDQVELTAVAVDFRGEAAGVSSVSQALRMDVVDAATLLDSIERDNRLDSSLTRAIQAQLGREGDR